MSRPELLVDEIRRLDEEMGSTRRELASRRRAAVTELHGLVGAVEAARLLGVSEAAIYKSIYASRKEA